MQRWWERSTTGGEDSRLVRLAGLALPAAVLVLGLLSPLRGGLVRSHLPLFIALLAAIAAVDQTAPGQEAAAPQRLLWLMAELVLSFFIVRVYGPPVRPSLIYLLPASRAVLMFGRWWGLGLSLSVWLTYGLSLVIDAWPSRLGADLPNYLSFFLAPYAVAVVLSLATLRQAIDRRRVQGLYDALRGAHTELQTLHQQVREAAIVEERNRLAREIHDTLAHYLTIVNVQLEAAEKLGDTQLERALQQVRRARRLTLECLREVRRSVAALRTSGLEELSPAGAIGYLCREFAENTGVEVIASIVLPEGEALPAEVTLALYRGAQEGLTNVQRHAAARRVWVTAQTAGDDVSLTVEDDGAGPADDAVTEAGFGLLGLRERVALLDGALEFGPGPHGGARLHMSVPLTRQAAGRPDAAWEGVR